jgi:hypothetical protein
MTDRDRRISAHQQVMSAAQSAGNNRLALEHWRAMRELIQERSKAQVRRMEKRMGLKGR